VNKPLIEKYEFLDKNIEICYIRDYLDGSTQKEIAHKCEPMEIVS
jgi:hypothetical protein